MKFSYYRLFVENTSQISLLSDLSRTKKQILEQAFDHDVPIYGQSMKQRFVYKRIARVGDLILGRVAKRATIPVEHSAEENFAIERVETWPGVYIVINLSDDPRIGQSIAVECNSGVFMDPYKQLSGLTKMVNLLMLKDTSFEVRVNPITRLHDFWQIVGDTQGRIKSLTLEFAAPNLFGARDELSKDLRLAQEQFGITDAAFTIGNTEGNLKLPPKNPFLQQSVEYITAGGGTFKIRTRDRKIISSKDSIATKDVGEVAIKASFDDPKAAQQFCDKLFLWLEKRE